MSGLFGNAFRSSTDDTFINTAGQQIIFDEANNFLVRFQDDFEQMISVFVGESTEIYTELFKLPGGGRMSERGRGGGASSVRPFGQWTVAYPLRDYAEQLAGDKRDFAHMTVGEFRLHMENIAIRYMNEARYRVLRRLLNNVATTFKDRLKGDLTIQPLANGDSAKYPPTDDSETDATEDHYLASEYTADNISDTNNPIVTMVAELDEHTGGPATGDENIAVFCNKAQSEQLKALTNFTEVPPNFITVGDNVDVPNRLPAAPGKVLGYGDGAWIIQWSKIPANYLLGINLDEVAPLKRRFEPAATGLPRGLQLVTTNELFPMQHSIWEAIEGYGVANRLNGVVMFLTASSSYTIPTDFD